MYVDAKTPETQITAQRGQPLLLDAVGIFMGIFMGQKIDLLGCIGTTRNLENQSQNPHWAICLPAIGLRVQPLQEIWSDFAKFACVTKMLLVHSNMDGFQILKILLVALIRAYHFVPKKSFYTPLRSGLSSIFHNFLQKKSLYPTSKL